MCVSSIVFVTYKLYIPIVKITHFFKNWKIKVEFTPPKLTAVSILEYFHPIFLYLHRIILNTGFVFVFMINVGQLHDLKNKVRGKSWRPSSPFLHFPEVVTINSYFCSFYLYDDSLCESTEIWSEDATNVLDRYWIF